MRKEDVRSALQAIHDKHDGLNEELVVDASRSKKSLLHPHFHWDDEREAARIGRLEIARKMICSVRITVEHAEELGCSTHVRLFHGNTGGGYHSIDTVLRRSDLRDMLLQSALRELDNFKRRFESLSELAPLFAEVEKVRTKHKKPAKRRKKKEAVASPS